MNWMLMLDIVLAGFVVAAIVVLIKIWRDPYEFIDWGSVGLLSFLLFAYVMGRIF